MATIREIAQKTNEAYKEFLGTGTTNIKNSVLKTIAIKIRENSDFIILENEKDLKEGIKKGYTKALLDRLALDKDRVEAIAKSCEEVIVLPDPVGEVYDMTTRPEGFRIGKTTVPIGVIGIIYEARPNVTIEAATLCLKSGNATILRGGTSAFNSNLALIKIVKEALQEEGINENLISYIDTPDRNAVDEMLVQDEFIHLIIPRGGESLIKRVIEQSTIPVLKHYKGICHTYVNEFADLEKAVSIAVNAKVQRPAVCNATETILIDEKIASEFVPKLAKELQSEGVEIRADEKFKAIYSTDVVDVTEEDWSTEYLDLIVSIKIVEDIEEAITHINKYNSGHTEAILTKDIATSEKFIKNVDSSSIIVNATTRLADGGVYGLGAEIGIATDRLHARGPMGLKELTTYKWIVYGNGDIRE